MEVLKRPLRSLRSSPLVNLPLTGSLRAALRLLGWGPGPLVRFLPRYGVVETTLPDGAPLRMWSRADDDVTGRVYWCGWAGHEPETASLFYTLARSARVTIDVGAHVGYFALLAAHANPSARVYAFEPHPLAYERLARNTALNHLANLSCERLAVGDTGGSAQFFHVPGGVYSSSSLSRDFMESIVDPGRLVASDVEVVSLDDFVAAGGVPHVDLVKIDTEATEDAVLRGSRRVLRVHRPVVFCEILHASTGRAIEELVAPLSYRYFQLQAHGPVECDRLSPHPSWRNACLVPSGGGPAGMAESWERLLAGPTASE